MTPAALKLRGLTPMVLIIGASGAGKSTLLLRCLSWAWPGGVSAIAIRKDTTRTLRGAAESAECVHVNDGEFRSRSDSGLYVCQYRIFGESYGIGPIGPDSDDGQRFYIQTVPTFVAAEMKRVLSSMHEIRILLLEANDDTLRERLHKRGDEATLRTLEERMMTSRRGRREHADYVIDASTEAWEVFESFRAWVTSVLHFEESL